LASGFGGNQQPRVCWNARVLTFRTGSKGFVDEIEFISTWIMLCRLPCESEAILAFYPIQHEISHTTFENGDSAGQLKDNHASGLCQGLKRSFSLSKGCLPLNAVSSVIRDTVTRSRGHSGVAMKKYFKGITSGTLDSAFHFYHAFFGCLLTFIS
jgi:hypothetical protein